MIVTIPVDTKKPQGNELQKENPVDNFKYITHYFFCKNY